VDACCNHKRTVETLVRALGEIDDELAPPGPWGSKVLQAKTTARLAIFWAARKAWEENNAQA